MTVDYAGTALSLGGCTLIILPLIWVCFSNGQIIRISTYVILGRDHFSLVICYRYWNACGWCRCGVHILPLGVERSQTTNRSECVLRNSSAFRADNDVDPQCIFSST